MHFGKCQVNLEGYTIACAYCDDIILDKLQNLVNGI